LRWALEHSTAILGVIGLFVYGVVRFGIDAFYSRLGVTADEVGLTYGAILSRAALGLLVILLFTMTAAAVSGVQFGIPYYFARRRADKVRKRRDAQRLLERRRFLGQPRYLPTRLEARQLAPPWFAITLLSLGDGALLVLDRVSTSAERVELGLADWALWLVFAVFTFIGAALVMWQYGRRAEVPAWPHKQRWPRVVARIALAGLVVSVVASALWVSDWAGNRAAQEVEAGRPITRSRTFSLTWIFDVEATCVTLAPVADDKPPSSSTTVPRMALYLGRSGSTVILYVPGKGPVRLPDGDYVITGVTTSLCTS
jgi:hypothetical protein